MTSEQPSPVRELELPGVYVVDRPLHADARGWFRKPYQRSVFAALGLPADYDESFFTQSGRGILRGLHLQTGASAQWKLVVCLVGTVWDCVLDLRAASETYGKHCAVELSGRAEPAILVPPGCAHGFLVQSESAVVGYWVTSEHDPLHDTGVRWDSAGIAWPLQGQPTISDRDAALPAFQEFPALPDPVQRARR